MAAGEEDAFGADEAANKQIFSSYQCRSSVQHFGAVDHPGDVCEATSLRWDLLGLGLEYAATTAHNSESKKGVHSMESAAGQAGSLQPLGKGARGGSAHRFPLSCMRAAPCPSRPPHTPCWMHCLPSWWQVAN